MANMTVRTNGWKFEFIPGPYGHKNAYVIDNPTSELDSSYIYADQIESLIDALGVLREVENKHAEVLRP